MLELELISKKFGTATTALKEVSISVKKGQTLVLLGERGSGKSTVVRIIARLIRPSSGVVRFGDSEKMPVTGYVIASGGLVSHLSVKENISIIPAFRKCFGRDGNERVQAMLELVGLEPDEVVNKLPFELTRKEIMQVALARALALNPELVLLDEPFEKLSSVDRDALRREFLRVRILLKSVTFVYATRDPVEAVKVGDNIAVIKDGEVLHVGTPKSIVLGTKNSYVDKLFKSHSFQIKLEAVSLSELMIRNPVHITTTQLKLPVSRAVYLMKRYRIGSLVVTTSSYEFKGIIRLEDIDESDREQKIRDVLRRRLRPLRTTDSFSDALGYFMKNESEFLPVINEHNKLQGLITRKGISKILERLL